MNDNDLKRAILFVATGLIVMVVVAFMASAFYTWQNPPEVNVLLAGIGQGALGILTMIAGFYFGSSRGSAEKDKTIATLAGNGKEHP